MNNETNSQQFHRRHFMALGVQGTVVAGLGLTAPSAMAAGQKPMATGFKHACDLTVMATGQIAVIGDRQLAIFSRNRRKIHVKDLGAAPQAVCAGAKGGLLVAMQDAILLLNDAGAQIGRWSLADRDGLAVTSISAGGDSVYVGDGVHGKVHRFTASGQYQGSLDQTFAAAANFFPVEVDAEGRLHVAHSSRHRVETFSPAGISVASWGAKSRDAAGFSGCCNPVDLAVLPDGKFVTAERGQPRIKLFSSKGDYIKTLAEPEQFTADRLSSYDNHQACSGGGLSVAAGPKGAVYALDHADSSLQRVS
ncbi:MAG: hypothetical protein IH892_05190 [Planctomycetes bacterium]|nr:hypothetical protein [Planctomycetota bacterium]